MESVSPWKIEGIKSHPDGYDFAFCLECANGDQIIQEDEIQIHQTAYSNELFLIIVIAVIASVPLTCYACRYLGDAKNKKVDEQKAKEQKKEDDS